MLAQVQNYANIFIAFETQVQLSAFNYWRVPAMRNCESNQTNPGIPLSEILLRTSEIVRNEVTQAVTNQNTKARFQVAISENSQFRLAPAAYTV